MIHLAFTLVLLKFTYSQSPAFSQYSQFPSAFPSIFRPIITQRLPGRISELKCEEYLAVTKKNLNFGPLSLISLIQKNDEFQCDASQGLIIGGEAARNGEFPHMAAIGYRTSGIIKYECGGTLISEQHVLTAAHCKSSNDGSRPTTVRVGSVDISSKTDSTQDKLIDSFIAHEDYNSIENINDIAIIKLQSEVIFGRNVRPACLPDLDPVIPENKAVATGWGVKDSYKQEFSNVLLKVSLSMLDKKKCNEDYEITLKESQLCAGDGSGKDTCGGDSGGPLQIVSSTNKCIYQIIGVTSFGNPYCGLGETSAVYTRVSSYLDWIESKVWG